MMAWEVFGGASLFGPIGDLCVSTLNPLIRAI
jgi:hypothetical protein